MDASCPNLEVECRCFNVQSVTHCDTLFGLLSAFLFTDNLDVAYLHEVCLQEAFASSYVGRTD